MSDTKKTPAKRAIKAKAAPAAEPVIVTYKGFSNDWKCRDFQYEVGKSYTHKGEVKACGSGFHACEHPLNVFDYYAPAGSRFAVVEQSGDLSHHDSDTKVASRHITIKAEIGIAGLVKAAIEYVNSRCLPIDPALSASATGYQGAASATGYQGAASATGYQGAASATGYQGAASATGNRGAASATGNQGAASATGNRGAAMASGYAGKAKGASGCALFLVHRDEDGDITHAGAAIVGRDGIKPDVWYSLDSNGKFVEADQ